MFGGYTCTCLNCQAFILRNLMKPIGQIFRLLVGAALVVVPALLLAQGNFSGATYTSLKDGSSVNQNIYADKKDVYLNGGPQNQNGAGLPDGVYFFQVTSPNGILLSSDPVLCRQVDVVGGVVAGYHIDPDCRPNMYHDNGDFNPANGNTPVQLVPYDNTPNNGGEYKLWLIRKFDDVGVQISFPASNNRRETELIFRNANAKTDNFKVFRRGGGGGGQTVLGGVKFFDADADGVLDPSDFPLEGFRINVFYDDPDDDPDLGWILLDPNNQGYTTVTGPDGSWSFASSTLKGVFFKVCEVLPSTGNDCEWVQTLPDPGVAGPDAGCWMGEAPNSGGFLVGLNFGNVCLCPLEGGHTRGYWHNINGADRFTADDLQAMVDLCLRDQDGSDFNPANHDEFASYLVGSVGANGRNMANMLSAQLAALVLNVRHFGDVGFNEDLNADTVVVLTDVEGLAECYNANFVAEGEEFVTTVRVGDIIAMAIEMTCDVTLEDEFGNMEILSDHPLRAAFTCIKDIIDSLNNNLLRSHDGTPCDVIYP